MEGGTRAGAPGVPRTMAPHVSAEARRVPWGLGAGSQHPCGAAWCLQVQVDGEVPQPQLPHPGCCPRAAYSMGQPEREDRMLFAQLKPPN